MYFSKSVDFYKMRSTVLKISYLLRQEAFLTRISHKSAKDMPRYFACSGTNESAVIPGLVFISNKTTPSFSL